MRSLSRFSVFAFLRLRLRGVMLKMAKKLKRNPAAFKKSASAISDNFSERAERVVDIIFDREKKSKGVKIKEVALETVSLLKDMRRQVSSRIGPRVLLRRAAYGAGKLSEAGRRACRKAGKLIKNTG